MSLLWIFPLFLYLYLSYVVLYIICSSCRCQLIISLPDSQLLCCHVDRPLQCLAHDKKVARVLSSLHAISVYMFCRARGVLLADTVMGVNDKQEECFLLSMRFQCTCACFAEHMVCWTSVQHPYMPCVTGLLQLSGLRVPVVCYMHACTFICVLHMHIVYFCVILCTQVTFASIFVNC